MASTAPQLTPEQRAAALVKATAVRMARRKFKDSVANGEVGFGTALVLAKEDPALAGIRVVHLLQCLPGVGPTRAREIMTQVGIAESRRVRGLGENQVSTLLTRLGT